MGFDFQLLDPETQTFVQFRYATESGPELDWGQNSQIGRTFYWALLDRWIDRHKARRALLGMPTFEATTPASYSYFSRALPHTLEIEDAEHLYCTVAKPIGMGQIAKDVDDDGHPIPGPNYKAIKFACTYEALPYRVLPDLNVQNPDFNGNPDESSLKRYVQYLSSPLGTYLSIRGGTYCFADPNNPNELPLGPVDPNKPGMGPTRIRRPVFHGTTMPTGESVKKIIWYKVPWANFNKDAATLAIGKCNNALWETAFGSFGLETMLLENWQPEFIWLPSKVWAANIAFTFKHKNAGTLVSPKGWNWVYDPKNSGELTPILSVVNDSPYNPDTVKAVKTFDITSLFKPIAASP